MSDFIDKLGDAWPQLMDGLWVTLELSVGGTVLAFVVAVVLGLAAIAGVATLRTVSRVIVEFFRGTSLVVQLFFLFYVLPQLGVDLPPLWAGILGLGLNYGAYGSEVVRGSLNAVPPGQWESTVALSMSWPQKIRRVIWPQAWALMLPGLNNLAVMLIKGTAVASLILLQDLTFWTNQLRRTEGLWFSFGLGFAIYYLLALALSTVLRLLERRAQRRLGLGRSQASTTRVTAEAVA